MSKKRSIILISVITAIMVIFVIFTTVFRVNLQKVTVVGEKTENISIENVISSSGIKKGKSIFLINKEQAINQIEKSNPYVKIEKIEIKFPNKIEYIISAREEFCFEIVGGTYTVFDNEFKALRKTDEKPSGLIEIKNLNATANVGEFATQNLIKNCFSIFEETFQISKDGQNSSTISLTKNEAKVLIQDISLVEGGQAVIFKTKQGFSVKIKNDEIFNSKIASFIALLENDANAPSLSDEERQSDDVFEFVKSGSGFNVVKIS